VEGKPLKALAAEYPTTKIDPHWKITKGEERAKLNASGEIEALEPGEITLQGTIPGLAADKGFLFIDALGRVGAIDPDGTIHWDIVGMIVFFGLSLYVNQMLSGPSGSSTDQQATINKLTPVIFSGMFLFFPLPAGVLMYMAIANVFQTLQTFILLREPLPENLQKIVEEQAKEEEKADSAVLPFEGRSKKKAKEES
jgi:YidC/Oxa1 family membrane protein insertase